MTSRWVRWLALLGLSLSYPATLAAHGGSAKIVRVAGVDEVGAPWLLQLNEGLALREPDGWRFVCPAALEASKILHALSADGDSAWAVTLRGLFRIAHDGRVERRSGQCGDAPLELVAHRGGAYLLARDSSRGKFVVCELAGTGPREIHASEVAADDLTSDGTQLWLTRTAGESFELERVGDAERRLYPGPPRRALRMAFAGDSLYASLSDFGRTTLVRLLPERVEVLLESATPLFGPVESRGIAFAGTNGKLFEVEGTELSLIDTVLAVENVYSLAGHGFAAADGALYALPVSSAEPPDAVFTLDGLQPPKDAATDACSEQWQRFELELHAPDHMAEIADAGTPDAGAPAAARSAESGCSLGGSMAEPSPLALAFCFAAALLARGRGRRPSG